MNSYYLFLTIHGYGVDLKEIKKVLKKQFPSWQITISDEEFKNVR